MKKTILTLAALALLQGCAASGIKNVKEDYSRHDTIYVQENYQSVYRKIARKVPECFTNPQAVSAQTNLYHDIQLGELSAGNMLGTFLVVQIAGIDAENSKVDIYTGVATWNKYIERVKGWIDGTYSGC